MRQLDRCTDGWPRFVMRGAMRASYVLVALQSSIAVLVDQPVPMHLSFPKGIPFHI
jgi:hypothetical protein